MRHRQSGRRLDMNTSQRLALFRNMATSLFLHGSIRTTEARAKELRPFAEQLLSIGKRAPSAADLAALSGDALKQAQAKRVNAIRRLLQVLEDKGAVDKVMGEYADRFRTRPGGYTRIVKLARPRPGDNADMAIIQLVEALEAAPAARPTETPAAQEPAPAE